MPLDPAVSPRIELSREPAVYIVRDEEWKCPIDESIYGLDEEGKDRLCVTCMLKKSGRLSITLFGWTVQLTAGMLVAQPPKHRQQKE
jgi:hypothetical protein